MKKNLLLGAALALTVPALAQTTRGDKLLGVSVGNLSYSRSKYRGSAFSAALHPTAGYFVANNLALGATLNLGYARQKYSNTDQFYRQLTYGLSPFARYYLPGSGRHRVFAEIGGDFNRLDYRATQYSYTSSYPPDQEELTRKTNSWGYHGALGYAYFLTPTAALEATAGYYRVGNDPVYKSRDIIDVRVGFNVYLPTGGAK